MTWEKVTRNDNFEGSDRPFISISESHIAFNAMFTKIAEIDTSYRVTFYADYNNLRLGFEFHQNERQDSFSLSQQSSAKKGAKRQGLQCAAQQISNSYPWIKAITELPTKERRFFNPKKEGQIWGIQLCPAFEETRARESNDIPSDITGIYRYRSENDEIVYIGRGEIKNRLKAPERTKWNFDKIEFSIIKDPDQQVRWESYWLEKYKKQNKGKLPVYNKISGPEIKDKEL